MKLSLINKLCCPQDKNDLSLQVFAKKQDETIQEGLLTCSHCGRYYPIVYGIPIMTPDEYRERALEQPLLKKWGLSMGGGKKFMLEIEEGAYASFSFEDIPTEKAKNSARIGISLALS